MKRFLVAALLIAAPAYAQQAPTYTLTVTDAELQVLSDGLGELPAKKANPVIAKLQGQVNAQLEAMRKAAEADKPKK